MTTTALPPVSGQAPQQQQPHNVQKPSSAAATSLKNLDEKITDVTKSKIWPFSGMAINTMFTISNLGSLTRNTLITLPSNLGLSLPKEGAVCAGYAYNSLMIASAFNSGIGLYSAEKNRTRMVAAAENGDGQEYVEAGVSLAAAGVQAVGGAAVLAASPLSLTCYALGINTGLTSPSLLGRVTYGIGQLASVAFGLFYTFIGIGTGLNIYHQVKFHSAYNKAKENGKELTFLTDQLKISIEEQKKIDGLTPEKQIAEAKKILPKLCPEVKMDRTEWTQCFDAIGNEELKKIGRVVMEKKLLLQKETHLKKVTSGECVKMLNNITVQPTRAEKTAILQKVESAWSQKMVINSLLAICCAFGVITTLAAFFFTAGIPAAIVTTLLILAVILPMTVVDGYAFYHEMKHGEPGKHDTKFLALSSLVCIAVVATSITLVSAFSFAIMPILITLFVGALWLGFNAFSYTRIKKRAAEIADEKRKNELVNGPPRNLIAEAIQQWKTETEQETAKNKKHNYTQIKGALLD